MKKEKTKKKRHNPKEDYTAIALFTLSKQHCKEYDKYAQALIKHLCKGMTKKQVDSFEDWVWQNIMEDDDYETLIENLNDAKKIK